MEILIVIGVITFVIGGIAFEVYKAYLKLKILQNAAKNKDNKTVTLIED